MAVTRWVVRGAMLLEEYCGFKNPHGAAEAYRSLN